MKEKEIRERIERFLKKTARNLVVPASVGLSLSGCDTHPLGHGRADAGRDVASQQSETADATNAADFPAVLPPYLVMMMPDADAEPVPADTASEAQALPDAGPEIPWPPVPYLVVAPSPDAAPPGPEAGTEVPLPPPPPPYLILPSISPSAPGGTAPMPLGPKKSG